MTPKIEAHLKGHDEPEFYAIYHDGVVVGNLDPDADIDFMLRCARFGVGPTEPSPSWTKTLVVLHNQLAQVDADRAALRAAARDDGETDDSDPF